MAYRLRVSAPGKIILSGEHAVVYGYPALIVAVDRRLAVTLSGKKTSIESNIPIGCGMGSSAALAVAKSGLLLEKKNRPWDLGGINKKAYELEKRQHGNPSGADNTISTHGGFLWYRKEAEGLKTFSPVPVSIRLPKFILINTGKPIETTKEMVSMVSKLVKKDPLKYKTIFTKIEAVTKAFLKYLLGEEKKDISVLLKENERLLEKLGVVSKSTIKIIREIERFGGAAKVSGAGGIKDRSGVLLAYHREPGKLLAFAKKNNLEAFTANLGEEGVRIEKKIKVSAPGKLMLFGEHAAVYGKPCIVTAVDQRMSVTVEACNNNRILINAPEVGINGFSIDLNEINRQNYPKEVAFILAAVRNFYEKYHLREGLEITTKSEFPSLFGFGSSSAVTVALTKALGEIFDIQVSRKELFDMCFKTVIDVQKVGSGFDIAAAIWGGTLYFISGGKKIVPILQKRLSLVVGYTGIKADTATLINSVAMLRRQNLKLVDSIFGSISLIVERTRNLLVKNNYVALGRQADMNQGLLDSLGVSTTELSSLIVASRRAGAYGAKLSGAGGGDCMIAFVSEKSRKPVEKAIEKTGGKVIDVQTGAEGVRIEKW